MSGFFHGCRKKDFVICLSDTISQDFPFFDEKFVAWCLKHQTMSLIKSKFSEKKMGSRVIFG
jgi:hypothetical protein